MKASGTAQDIKCSWWTVPVVFVETLVCTLDTRYTHLHFMSPTQSPAQKPDLL